MIRVDGSGSSSSLIKVRGLNKTYKRGGEQIQVLQGLNLDADKGDFVAFMGPSGSGKTTLLNLLGGLDVPSAGSITVTATKSRTCLPANSRTGAHGTWALFFRCITSSRCLRRSRMSSFRCY